MLARDKLARQMGRKLAMEVRDGKYPDERILVLSGVLTAETSPGFHDAVRQNEASTLLLDMTAVQYIDSTGLGAIIGAYVSFERRLQRLLLAGLNDRTWDLFRTCKVADVFTRYATVAEAEKVFTQVGASSLQGTA
jgi:anti-sigma B factor antagonist